VLDDLVQHWLKAFRPRDGTKNLADRPPLLAQAADVPEEILGVARLAATHATGLYAKSGSMPARRSDTE
jgi:hypothetical protein